MLTVTRCLAPSRPWAARSCRREFGQTSPSASSPVTTGRCGLVRQAPPRSRGWSARPGRQQGLLSYLSALNFLLCLPAAQKAAFLRLFLSRGRFQQQ